MGKGQLILNTIKVSWVPENSAVFPQSWGYKDILMHAITTDPDFSAPCIYCHLDGGDEEEVNEARFVPESEADLNALFNAFSKGAELNPDEVDEDEGDFFFNPDEIMSGLSLNDTQTQQNDTQNQENQNFEDGDPEEEDEEEEQNGKITDQHQDQNNT
uniref:Uncharacterized protein n=1 Tax=Arcella intermedia TaxID=1963864 RepID=A0A6B2LN43_9EUKA